MYNKKLLSKIDLGKSTKINPYKKDIIYDPMGQWKYPGQPTRIPSSNITMKGVNYPVLAVTDNGQKKMMQPGKDYKFPGAKYVDEFPQAKKGGSLNSKKYTRSLDGIGSLFRESDLFKKPKSSKKKLFHPHAKYYAEGGEEENSRPCPTGYIYSVELEDCIPNAEYKIIESEVNPEAAILENIKYKKANDYLTQYYNSPKYKEMLKNSSSSPEGYKWLLESRNKQLASTPPLQILPQPSNSPTTGGQSWSSTGQIELFPNGFGTIGTSLHELSHSSDRPLPGHSQRLIPKSDIDYINKHKGKVLGDSRDFHNNKQWYNEPNAQKDYKDFYSDYVGDATETRARLNAIRQGAKQNGLYDPFTEGVSNDLYLNKLKNFQFEKGDKSGFDPMEQLQGTYSDEEIIWMLNHISKNEDKKEEEGDQSFAKKGGTLNRFIGGGDPDPLDPHQVFLKNWYENRVFPKELEKARPAILSQFNQSFPSYVVTDKLPADALAAYNNMNNTVELNQNYPKDLQESSKTHELNHWATDTADEFLNEPHGYLIEDNIINPKNINTGSPESDTYTKDNFEYLVSPREVHSRIMTFRELAGFKPNQIITEKDVEDYLNKAGDKLDPDIKDLKNVTKGNKAMVELLNGMALNNTPISDSTIQYSKKGGAYYDDSRDAWVEADGTVGPNGPATYQKGGESKCPPGYIMLNGKCTKVEPFVTSNKKEYDYRKKMYNDSLNLYKENAKWQPARDKAIQEHIKWTTKRGTVKKSDINKVITDNTSKKIKIPNSYINSLQNNPSEANQWNRINKKIKPINIGRVYAANKKGNVVTDIHGVPLVFEYPVFKKPVQPVVLSNEPKKEIKKAIPTTRTVYINCPPGSVPNGQTTDITEFDPQSPGNYLRTITTYCDPVKEEKVIPPAELKTTKEPVVTTQEVEPMDSTDTYDYSTDSKGSELYWAKNWHSFKTPRLNKHFPLGPLFNGKKKHNFSTPALRRREVYEFSNGGALDKFVDGGEEDFYTIPGNKSVYRKVNGNWQVDSNRSGNFQPLSKGDVSARTAVLNTQAKQLFDPMYSDMFNTKKAGYKSVPKEQPPIKKQTVQDNKAQESFNNNFKVSDASNAEKIKNAIEQDKQKFIQLGKEQGFEVTQEDLDNVETRGWQHYASFYH